MNLTTGKWIPVVWADGKSDKVSLLDVFQRGNEIRDLAVRPHERIALMRLLICVAQAALDGPKDREEWKTCKGRLPKAATDYLKKWESAFELFGDGPRFLQVEGLRTSGGQGDTGNSASKLDMALATGVNASTLFDNAGGSMRVFKEDELAIMLLTYQNFSPCGIIGAVSWGGELVIKGTARHAPCTVGNMLHSLIMQDSILSMVVANLITRERVHMIGQEWGLPSWEMIPTGFKDSRAVRNSTQTYMGRLCPYSRLVRLDENQMSVLLGIGLDFPEWREATASIKVRQVKGESVRKPLYGSSERAIWRELAAVTVLSNDGVGGPLAFCNLDAGEDVVIWVGALAAKGNSSIDDMLQSAFAVPSEMFADKGRFLYQKGVSKALIRNEMLKNGVKEYARHMMVDGLVGKASSHYWTAIEQQVSSLLALVENPEPLRPEGATKDNWAGTEWGKTIAQAAREAYELACPHETPRQLRAYSLGLRVLIATPLEKTLEESVNEEET